MARPKIPIQKRVSGVHKANTKEGKLSANQAKYCKVTKTTVQPDYDKIKSLVQGYIDSETGLHNGAGLRLALDISKSTYNLWLQGYTCKADADAENITRNETLANIIRYGHDTIIAKAFNNELKYSQRKIERMLEGMGEFTPSKKIVDLNINGSLGTVGKWGK